MLLIVSLLAGILSGCGTVMDVKKYVEDKLNSGGKKNGSGSYFNTDIWRGDVSFSNMTVPAEYDITEFNRLVERLRSFAEGGNRKDFEDAEYDVWNEVCLLESCCNLTDICCSQDETDEEADRLAESYYSLYSSGYESYLSALHDVAVSPNKKVMKEVFADWQIESLAAYVPRGEEEIESDSREYSLELEYYNLMLEESPDPDEICSVFVELVNLRNRMAQLGGYSSYAEYCYGDLYARDYTIEDAARARDYIRDIIGPTLDVLYMRVDETKAEELLYSEKIDCSEEAILNVMKAILEQMSPELSNAFDYMLRYDLYDISPAVNKRQSGFTTFLRYWYEPFLFNCPSELWYDYTDMFHEFGHFANYYYSLSDIIFGAADNDLAELQSQGLELLSTLWFDEYFGEETSQAIRDDLVISQLYGILDGALYDEFQERCFAEQDLTVERVYEIYKELYEAYGFLPYDGYEYEWMNVEHNFTYPFYYISYAVSSVPALEIYSEGLTDRDTALDRYLRIEAMNCEEWYLSEALEQCGLSGVFEEETYLNIAKALTGK